MSSGAFGDNLQSTVLYEVNCAGNETEILSCSPTFSGTCTEHSAAIICQGAVVFCSIVFSKLSVLVRTLFEYQNLPNYR